MPSKLSGLIYFPDIPTTLQMILSTKCFADFSINVTDVIVLMSLWNCPNVCVMVPNTPIISCIFFVKTFLILIISLANYDHVGK